MTLCAPVVIIVALLVLSLLTQVLGRHFQVPFIPFIFLFIEGIIVGSEVLNLLNPVLCSDVLNAIASICVPVIVFDGEMISIIFILLAAVLKLWYITEIGLKGGALVLLIALYCPSDICLYLYVELKIK